MTTTPATTSATMQGADTDGLRKVGQDCQQGAQVAQEAIAFLTALVAALKAASFFTGGASAAYAEYLETVVIPWLKRIEEALQLFAKVLDGQAQSQDDASSTGTVDGALPSYQTPALPAGDTRAYPVMQLGGSTGAGTGSDLGSLNSLGSTSGTGTDPSLSSGVGSFTGGITGNDTIPSLDPSSTGAFGNYGTGNDLGSFQATSGLGTDNSFVGGSTGADSSGLFQPTGLQDSGSTISDPVPGATDTSYQSSGSGALGGGSLAGGTFGGGAYGGTFGGGSLGTGSLGTGSIGTGTGGTDTIGQTDTSGLGADTITGTGSGVDGSSLAGATGSGGIDTSGTYSGSDSTTTADAGTGNQGGSDQTVTDASHNGHGQAIATGGAAAALGVGGAGALAAAAKTAGSPQDPAGWTEKYTSPNTHPDKIGTIRVKNKDGSYGTRPIFDMTGHEPPKTKPAGNLTSWMSDARKVLTDNGTDMSNVSDDDLRKIVIKHESSGNPHALNRWDTNAEKGIPSKGLMQTIDPTFNKYSVPGHRDIWNPVDNIVAGVRYSAARYHGVDKIPGVVSVHAGKPYKPY